VSDVGAIPAPATNSMSEEKRLEFTLDGPEVDAYLKFKKDHVACGWPIAVTFTLTGIGILAEVQCTKCRIVEDISDYDSW